MPDRTTRKAAPSTLVEGQRLDQPTFHALYEATDAKFKAELIGGKVYIMASPLLPGHGRPHSRLMGWLEAYSLATPGTDVLDNTTTVLGDDSEPQPDACLLILPECGGQTLEGKSGWLEGTPELIIEIASSSESFDLHEKRDEYERYGVKEYLVFAAKQKRVFWWIRRAGLFEELSLGADGIYRSETFPGLWLDPAALGELNSIRLHDVLHHGLASPEHAAFVAQLQAARKS